MSDNNNEDKATVVIDLNALKKQKQQEQQALEDLPNEIEFNANSNPEIVPAKKDTIYLLDMFSDQFSKNIIFFPKNYDYKVILKLDELTAIIKTKEEKILFLDYDSNPKMINKICSQIKSKFPHVKTILVAKSISPEKAKVHAESPSGASGYYKLPFDAKKIESEISKFKIKLLKKSS